MAAAKPHGLLGDLRARPALLRNGPLQQGGDLADVLLGDAVGPAMPGVELAQAFARDLLMRLGHGDCFSNGNTSSNGTSHCPSPTLTTTTLRLASMRTTRPVWPKRVTRTGSLGCSRPRASRRAAASSASRSIWT